jgi:hypothetical protein
VLGDGPRVLVLEERKDSPESVDDPEPEMMAPSDVAAGVIRC